MSVSDHRRHSELWTVVYGPVNQGDVAQATQAKRAEISGHFAKHITCERMFFQHGHSTYGLANDTVTDVSTVAYATKKGTINAT